MIMATVILIFSTALFFFYVQGVCQKILRRQFAQQFSQMIVNANGFEFPSVRKALEDPRLMMTLRGEFQALTYLVKNAANANHRHTYKDQLLIVYFKLVFVSLVTRHWLKLQETPAALKLTAILEYFANVVGERISLTASNSLSNL
jgi:hypothetical protein